MYRNRTALVTGGGSGIGQCLLEHLCANGATVICADINADAGHAVVNSVNAARGAAVAHFVRVDVSRWDSVCEMFREIEGLLDKEAHGAKLDFVFANAGVVGKYDPEFASEPDLADIKVNVIGVAYTIQAAMQYFLSKKHPGRIVVTASQASLYPLYEAPMYAASKHAVMALTRSLGRRAILDGIMINAVGPGITESHITSEENIEFLKKMGWYTPKSTILRAFDLLLAPSCKLSGRFVDAFADTVAVHEFPAPSAARERRAAKL